MVCLAAQHPGQLPKRNGTVDVAAPHERGLPHVAERHHEAERRRGVGQGDHAGDMPQRAVEPQLTAEGEPLCAADVELPCGHEQSHRDGKVQARTAFSDARRCQVDHRPAKRPGEAAGQQGGTDPISGLSHRCIGQPDDGEPGSPLDT